MMSKFIQFLLILAVAIVGFMAIYYRHVPASSAGEKPAAVQESQKAP